MQQIISLLMENKPGALMRVTGVLGQRGYNIESLTVARTIDPTLSRMTITVDVEPNIRAQVIKQMNKLINVLQATDVTDGPGVNRELILVRIRASQDSRTAIFKGCVYRKVDSSQGSAIPGDGCLNLRWDPPEGALEIRVVAKQGAVPADLNDGKAVSGVTLRGVTDLSMMRMSPSSMPASFIDRPFTRPKNVEPGRFTNSLFRSIVVSK